MRRRSRSVLISIAFTPLVLGAAKCYGQTVRASDILERYVAASGGEAAIRAVTTRLLKGRVETPGGEAPLEIIQATPDRFLRIVVSPVSGRAENGYDGRTAWSKNEDAGTREITGPAVSMMLREQHIDRPLAIRDFYSMLGDPRPDTLLGAQVFVIAATTKDGVAETLYFDRETGLLAGWDVAAGAATLRSRVDDYRRVDGVLLPFRIRRSRPDFAWTEQFTDIRNNVPVDSLRFSKPKI